MQCCAALRCAVPCRAVRCIVKSTSLLPVPVRPCQQVFRRVETGPGREEYRVIGSFEAEPTPPLITEAFQAAWRAEEEAAAQRLRQEQQQR